MQSQSGRAGGDETGTAAPGKHQFMHGVKASLDYHSEKMKGPSLQLEKGVFEGNFILFYTGFKTRDWVKAQTLSHTNPPSALVLQVLSETV